MLSKQLSQQYERALSLLEAQQTLEADRRSHLDARLRELQDLIRSEAEGTRRYLEALIVNQRQAVEELLRGLAKIEHNNTGVLKDYIKDTLELHGRTYAATEALGEKLDRLSEQFSMPQGDTPTIEEMIELSKSDTTIRKVLQNTLAELEFSDPVIEIN